LTWAGYKKPGPLSFDFIEKLDNEKIEAYKEKFEETFKIKN